MPEDQLAIINPKTKAFAYTPKEIKEVTLEYCANLLTNAEPRDEFKDLVKYKEMIHKVRMEEKLDNDIEELPYVKFEKIFNEMKRKPGNKYKFLTDGGHSLKMALYNLF